MRDRRRLKAVVHLDLCEQVRSRLTKRIRETVVDNDTLSFTAKNVKIITQNGKVTLRGPVRNQHERREIEQVAVKVAGEGQVENELEIR